MDREDQLQDDFAAFYRAHLEVVLSFCFARTQDAELSADIAAEVFAAALQSRDRYRADRGSLRQWLLGITAHKTTDAQRHGRVERRAQQALRMAEITWAEDDLDHVFDVGRRPVEELLAMLPERQREAVRARVLDERDYEDIAQGAGVSDQLVRQRVSRGLATLDQGDTMTTGFDQLERELAAAERRVAHAGQAGKPRWRPRASVLVSVCAVIIALVVAGGAVVLLGGGAQRGSPAQRGASGSTTPSRHISTYPPSSAAAFVRLLGVLRRPQTAADQTSPLLRSGAQSTFVPVRRDARLATTTRAGQRVFVIVAHNKQRAGQAAGARVLLEVDAAFGSFTVADVQSGRASFSAGNTTGSEDTFVLVPDGVSRVAFAGGGAGDQAPVSAVVHSNVAIFYTAKLVDAARNMRWYSATGKAIPIHNHPNPPAAPYPVNASGQTYGSEANGAAGRVRSGEEPDLILVTGNSLHGTGRVTGYVRRTQLNANDCGHVKTLKQAAACTKRTAGKTRTIPVYTKNGKTAIGTSRPDDSQLTRRPAYGFAEHALSRVHQAAIGPMPLAAPTANQTMRH